MEQNKDKGFVLIASLTIIALMTMGNLAMYFRSVSNIQTNASLADRVQAGFYAETAVNYMDWAMVRVAGNDADLDPYTVVGGDFGSLLPTVRGGRVDRPELNVSYFDNRPLANRKVNFQVPVGRVSIATDMKAMWADLPNLNPNPKSAPYCFVKLWITTDAAGIQRIQTTVTNQLPQAGEDGALMWLTASPAGSVPGGLGGMPADVDMVIPAGLLGGVNGGYDLVVYALGYINGRPRNLLRKKIRKVE